MWSLWTARNNLLFRDTEDSPHDILARAGRLLEDYKDANQGTVGTTPVPGPSPVPRRWSPPPRDILKLNSDATIGTVGSDLGFI